MTNNDTLTPWQVMFEQPAPPPLNLIRLREHFRNIYKLKDEQVDFMIRSASQSLKTAIVSAEAALTSDQLCNALAPVAHGLKGFFLNMGEGEWASLARAMEVAAKDGQEYDYKAVVEKIRQGGAVLLTDLSTA